ncbi:unnamed protein product [Leptidea sinapis]|uniref:Acyltransferase 3 domain-containing protein n=1 Tax=Leptidea sinapis TaxID=189913 RepID=A0A5E4QJX5_9NEOP|nr:unnamed protein product [Leptidea sinapis]
MKRRRVHSEFKETEYDRMPPVYRMDNYSECVGRTMAHYCTVHFTLVSDAPSELLFMIQEYSLKYTTHFNHSDLRYGICIKEKCPRYSGNQSLVSEEHLEACLNETFWSEYKLRTRVQHASCHRGHDTYTQVDTSDVFTGLLVLFTLTSNVVGSLYDILTSHEKQQGNNLLMCFSVKENWLQLTSTSDHFGEELKQFRAIYGIRALVIVSIVFGHMNTPFQLFGDNVRGMEEIYHDPLQMIVFSGSLLVQIFFVLAGFLLAYKLQKLFEKTTVSWDFVPKTVFFRWLRLTPPYAILVALMATWLRFTKSGPFWEVDAGLEVADCRRRWWLNLLYVNNYVYKSQCIPQSWYIAADMQLWILGLVVCLVLRGSRYKKWLLGALVAAGVAIPALHTYFQDLEAMLLLHPSGCRSFFSTDPTYNEVYKRGHTNLVSFAIGLATGYLVYDWQERDVLIANYVRYRLLHWLIIPLGAAFMWLGSVFYRDAPRDPLLVRTAFAAVCRPIMGFLTAAFILGMIFRIDRGRRHIKEDPQADTKKERKFQMQELLRAIMEWKGWILPGRLSYCVYLIHYPLIRLYGSTRVDLIYTSPLSIYLTTAVVTVVSFLVAVPLSLLVELPFIRVGKLLARKETPHEDAVPDHVYSTHL